MSDLKTISVRDLRTHFRRHGCCVEKTVTRCAGRRSRVVRW